MFILLFFAGLAVSGNILVCTPDAMDRGQIIEAMKPGACAIRREVFDTNGSQDLIKP